MSNFIGKVYHTTKGSEIKIISAINRSKSLFLIECSVCSKDSELFPDKYIKAVKSSLDLGRYPCACSNRTQWSEHQNEVRAERLAKAKGYTFNGWEGEYKGSKTYLKLYNPVTDNTWSTTTLHGLLNGKGDPTQRASKIKESLVARYKDKHTEDFKSAGFPEGTIFRRTEERDNTSNVYWEYFCPLCAQDEYAKAGTCDGWFKTLSFTLKLGRKPCRCSDGYSYTESQLRLRLETAMKKYGNTFISWEGEYNGLSTSFKWKCKEGHINTTSAKTKIWKPKGCMECQKVIGFCNGYYPERAKEDDILYVIDFGKGVVKVGRAFNLENRISKGNTCLLRVSGRQREDLTILTTFTGKHEDVYRVEQKIHQNLRDKGYDTCDEKWSIEIFDISSLPLIMDDLNLSVLERCYV